jgi:hypothetical protein
MDPAPPPKPNNVVDIDNSPPLYPQTIARLAFAESPNRFQELPVAQTLRFGQHPIQNRKDHGKSTWPEDTLVTMLAVGVYDGSLTDARLTVYVFVHGPKRNQIGYCYRMNDSSAVILESQALSDSAFEELFCDLETTVSFHGQHEV